MEEKHSSETKEGEEKKQPANITMLDYSDSDSKRLRKWLTFSKSKLVFGFERMSNVGK